MPAFAGPPDNVLRYAASIQPETRTNVAFKVGGYGDQRRQARGNFEKAIGTGDQ